LCDEAADGLAELFVPGRAGRTWSDHVSLAQALLRDDPAEMVDAYAAALRVARFGNANEHADWETAHHVFTYANALHQMAHEG
jgi:hypothetical protein